MTQPIGNHMNEWFESSQLSGSSSAYLDAIYEDYLQDKSSVDPSWVAYFDSISEGQKEVSHAQVREDFKQLARAPQMVVAPAGTNNPKQLGAIDLLNAYRAFGHFQASLDPLGIKKPIMREDLDLAFHGLSKADLNQTFNFGSFSDNKELKLADAITKMKATYAGTTAYEYMHVPHLAERMWLRDRIEAPVKAMSSQEKKWLLTRLTAAEGLEKYLAMRYVGQKRFGLEGGESMIPAINRIIEKATSYGVKEIPMGMAHRGRLNVLVNVMGKKSTDLFDEFEGKQPKKYLSGDVKYHMGYSSYQQTNHGAVRLLLAFNPSHLETVDPVVEGAARARQDTYEDTQRNQVMPILMHGDSAFCGQGVVMETFALSQTRYYGTGGTIHIVTNNQVGFTTNKQEDNRSSHYSTDIAKMIDAPVFHVNGDDPEAVLRVAELAIDYRMAFNKDVVIDLICYRRNGHNEADEPSGTQPEMYAVIKKLPSTLTLYAQALVNAGVVSEEEVKAMSADYREKITKGEYVVDVISKDKIPGNKHDVNWKPYLNQAWDQAYESQFDREKLLSIANQLTTFPEGLELQPQVAKAIQDRVKMNSEEIACNWGYAENLAYATLLAQGYDVRLSGEDCGRGTFSHRHAVLHNYDYNNKVLTEYVPLQHINKDAKCVIVDSVLSEYAVLGFEYGYSCTSPESLVIWEGQFGDFANTAQVVIDQFIAAAEEKWGILSGLVMLLPHGQEGAGAEHSSARLERFLQLCANDNMQVCVPTTPAQIYHMLRRQMIRTYRKPLIVMSPKSLLRHPLVTSTIDDLANGTFENVIGEIDDIDPKQVKRVLLCSGKVYYDLLAKRREQKITDVAIVRLEQLYPFPSKDLSAALAQYSHVSDVVWVQEEPENQGAWWMIQHHIREELMDQQKLSYVGRNKASAPAVGYPALFHEQQEALVAKALKISN